MDNYILIPPYPTNPPTWRGITIQPPQDTTKEVKQMNRGRFQKGTFVTIKSGLDQDYTYAKEGVLIWVEKDNKDYKENQSYISVTLRANDNREYFGGIPLVDKNYEGNLKWYLADDFREATSIEVSSRLTEVKKIKSQIVKHKWKIGDCIQLNTDLKVVRGSFFFLMEAVIRKGTTGVIDEATGEYEEANNLDPNRGHADIEVSNRCTVAKKKLGSFMLEDFLTPLVHIYFPESESEEAVPVTAIERKTQTLANAEIVLPNGHLDRIMRVVNRVVNRKVCEQIYEELGLWKVCQKGRGALLLLYGPPGTGKTMTAEVISDRLNRPLIRLSLRMFDNQTMERLKSAFIRAQKYNAVLLLDEVDVFIRKRGDNPLFDEHTAVFLRALEYYDGILFMTTNLVSTIDPAVFSRVHVCLGFDTSEQDRKSIWKTLLTPQLLTCVSGSSEDHEAMITKLADFKINGREIKTVIQNAVSHAVYELHGKPIPTGVKWISRSYFISEAEALQAQRDELKRG